MKKRFSIINNKNEIKRITMKALKEKIGEEKYAKCLKDAYEIMAEDPYISKDFPIAGGERVLTEFYNEFTGEWL